MSTAASGTAARRQTFEETDQRDWREPLARFGLLGKGVLHVVIGVSVWRLATGSGSASRASSTGAVQWIADQQYGTAVLWVLAASLGALAGWQAVAAFAGDPVGEDGAAHRVGFAGMAIAYGALAYLCVASAVSGGSSSSGTSNGAEQASETVFDLPMGRWLVFATGIVIMGVAVHLAVLHAVDGRFLRRLRVREGSVAANLGRVGYGLRSVAFLLVGFFVAQAGLTHDPEQAEGLSGSLRRLTDEAWGPAVLVAAAVGFVAFGVYCFLESHQRRSA